MGDCRGHGIPEDVDADADAFSLLVLASKPPPFNRIMPNGNILNDETSATTARHRDARVLDNPKLRCVVVTGNLRHIP